MDLIDRQAAIDICNYAADLWHGQLGEGIVIAVRKRIEQLPAVQPQPEEDCDTCKHGYFGDRQCDNCRVRYPSHYEREEEHHGSD